MSNNKLIESFLKYEEYRNSKTQETNPFNDAYELDEATTFRTKRSSGNEAVIKGKKWGITRRGTTVGRGGSSPEQARSALLRDASRTGSGIGSVEATRLRALAQRQKARSSGSSSKAAKPTQVPKAKTPNLQGSGQTPDSGYVGPSAGIKVDTTDNARARATQNALSNMGTPKTATKVSPTSKIDTTDNVRANATRNALSNMGTPKTATVQPSKQQQNQSAIAQEDGAREMAGRIRKSPGTPGKGKPGEGAYERPKMTASAFRNTGSQYSEFGTGAYEAAKKRKDDAEAAALTTQNVSLNRNTGFDGVQVAAGQEIAKRRPLQPTAAQRSRANASPGAFVGADGTVYKNEADFNAAQQEKETRNEIRGKAKQRNLIPTITTPTDLSVIPQGKAPSSETQQSSSTPAPGLSLKPSQQSSSTPAPGLSLKPSQQSSSTPAPGLSLKPSQQSNEQARLAAKISNNAPQQSSSTPAPGLSLKPSQRDSTFPTTQVPSPETLNTLNQAFSGNAINAMQGAQVAARNMRAPNPYQGNASQGQDMETNTDNVYNRKTKRAAAFSAARKRQEELTNLQKIGGSL